MAQGLEVSAVSVALGGYVVLDRVDLSVQPGEAVALLGPSGAGKSTLLRVIAGLEAPDSGRVTWEGADLADIPAHRRRFGLVFQDAMLFPHRDVGANVAYGLEREAMGARERARAVDELLSLVGLAGFADRRVETLSGGQAQRVALARALAPGPRLILLDEPFGALDRELRERLSIEVRDLLRSRGTPSIHVTHDPDEAHLVADRVLRMVEGPSGSRLVDEA
ncbi:unannotated protein [freshwater metagenome]|uniref:Unannotated protein n=1 Tax=freshwater metagenome TaxID=449393 RepID=A0A6J7KH82_9ZZZZ|nr:ATP-binding cassette domain-containing protein [Actinomycetota bacterium]MSW37436.1 ATP-binding cassette domain-containing protein [Actinomycetota bacterium]